MGVTLRRLTGDDLRTFYGDRPKPTISGWAGVDDDGNILGIGGLVYSGGRVFIFSDLTPEARRCKISMHRIALRLMAQVREANHKTVFAEASEATSDRWLRRLGFEHDDDTGLYIWRAMNERT